MESITYDDQYASIKSCFEALQIQSSKVTHAMRGCGARAASLGGASDDAIRRQGRWNVDAMTSHYLSQISHEAVRALASFPVQRGSFYLERGILEPPDELKKLVFPTAEECLTTVLGAAGMYASEG